MKKILILLFSLFLLSSSSVFADDISEFSIEGISIGDSLLDYLTEDEILKEIERTKNLYFHLNEPNKYAELYLYRQYVNYDYLALIVKNNSLNTYVSNKNEKYTILSIRGDKSYIEDFDSCIQKRDEIAEILTTMFINADKFERVHTHSSDPSGDSIIDAVYFVFDSGDEITAHCSNYEETFRLKNNYSEGISVAIDTQEINDWLRDN